ncbi:aminomethyl-transferring glycine dehydrogenase subunit GcvPA [candidate division WOR-3 bacterium]|nr:aminomethyl-transferring glycine dehydrogenase subunit GcvPA [candidate division WOR-3 bacterium]
MRYTPHTGPEREAMLAAIGVKRVEDLFAAIPADIRLDRPLDLPEPSSELEALRLLRDRAGRNLGASRLACFAGAGAYDHFSPAVVDSIISRSEFYTAYTPYQAEVSQGTLQSIYEFQSLTCRLFGMEVANASMYDAGSALAETCHMARDITRRERVLVSASVHPAARAVIRTYCRGLNVPVDELELEHGITGTRSLAGRLDDRTAAVIVQNPNFFGSVEPLGEIGRLAHDAGALLVTAVDPVSLGVLAPPGAFDADIAVAEGQGLGLGLNFGGPYLGMMATKRKFVRNLPGRLVGRTADVDGRTGYVLALQTREQHIRREKATSNICTNQALMALAASVWLAWFGRTGLEELGRQCLAKTKYLAAGIAGVPGFTVENERPFFKEFAVRCPVPARQVVERGLDHGLLCGVDLGRFDPAWSDRLLVAVTEQRTRAELDRYLDFLRSLAGGA